MHESTLSDNAPVNLQLWYYFRNEKPGSKNEETETVDMSLYITEKHVILAILNYVGKNT